MKRITAYVTASEAAAMLGVSTQSIRRWVESGRLNGGFIGPIVCVEMQSVAMAASGRWEEVERE